MNPSTPIALTRVALPGVGVGLAAEFEAAEAAEVVLAPPVLPPPLLPRALAAAKTPPWTFG